MCDFKYNRYFYKYIKKHFKNRQHGLKQRLIIKHRLILSKQFSRTSHAEFIKLWIKFEDSIGLQSDQTGYVTNISNKSLTKDA